MKVFIATVVAITPVAYLFNSGGDNALAVSAIVGVVMGMVMVGVCEQNAQ